MIAPEYFNNHIAVEGEIIVKRVPNDTGSVMVWNPTTKKISIRTHSEIISDLSLMTANTDQNVIGRKEFRTSAGDDSTNNTLWVTSDDGHYPAMTFYRPGIDSGQIKYLDSDSGFYFVNSPNSATIPVTAQKFIKAGSSNDYMLMGDGSQLSKYKKEDAWVTSQRNFTAGTLISTLIDYSQSQGGAWLLEIKANAYGQGIPIDCKVQGYIYNDTIINTTGYCTNPYLKSMYVMNVGGKLCFWFPPMAYWQGFSVRIHDVTGGGELPTINQVISIDDSSDPGGTKRVLINIQTLATKEELISSSTFWEKKDIGSYWSLDSDKPIAGLNGNGAQVILSGGLLASDYYIDRALIPSNGIHSKGSVQSDEGFVNRYYKVNQRNKIWNFGDSTAWGLSYFQGSYHSIGEGISFHFGDASDYKFFVGDTGNIYTKGDVISGNNFNGRGFYSPVLSGGQVIHAGNNDEIYFGNPVVKNVYIESGDNNLLHNRAGYGAGIIWDQHNFNPNNYIPTSHPAYGVTSNEINDWRHFVGYWDNRNIQPAHILPQKFQIGFTSWDNNQSAPWADYIHFGGYQDSSGGNQNLIVIKKNGFGLRQWQGSPQGVADYQSYVDYWNTDDFTNTDVQNWKNNANSIVIANEQDPNDLFAKENKFGWINGAMTGAGGINSWVGNYLSIGGNNNGHKSQLLISKNQLLFRGNHGNEDTAFNEVYHSGNVGKFIFGDNGTGTINAYDISGWTHPVKSGFYRPNSLNDWGSLLMWAEHPQTGTGTYGAGIAFDYAGTEAYLTGIHSDGSKEPNKKIWTSGNLNKNEFVNLESGKSSISISNTDLNDLQQTGFFKGSNLGHSPTGTAEWFFVTNEYHNTGWISQTATSYGTGAAGAEANRIFKRAFVSGSYWTDWYEVYTSFNLNPATFVSQSSLNTQLLPYATLAGVQTFQNTNIFAQSPVVPNGTLGTHAVNLDQLLSVALPFQWNWSGSQAILDRRVIGELAWKNFGNGHTIFDASSSLSPWGASISNTDAQIPWSPSYPTLMGGNGSETFGVRVDSARVADSIQGHTVSDITKAGGINLFPNSSNFKLGGSDYSNSDNSVLGQITVSGTGNWNAYATSAIKEYTPVVYLTFQIEVLHNDTEPRDFTQYFYYSGGNLATVQTAVPPNVWTKIYTSGKTNGIGGVLVGLASSGMQSGTIVKYRNIQVEESRVASTYRPALEDNNINDYWKIHDLAGFRGINTNKPFAILNNGEAQKVYTNGLLVSNFYQDEGLVPTNGIYSKGDILTSGTLLIGSNVPGFRRVLHLAEPTFTDSYGFNFYTDSGTGLLSLYGLNNGSTNSNPILSANRSNNFIGINRGNPTSELDVNGTISTSSHGTSEQWQNVYQYALMNRGRVFSSNVDANNISVNTEIVSIELPNGSGNTNFPFNNYGTFMRMQSNTFVTDFAHENNGKLWFRNWYIPATANGSVWRHAWDSENFNPSQYVLQSSLNLQLGNYATLHAVQTFTNTNTFSQSPVIPNGILGTHAVNKNQIELSATPESEGGQQLNISGNNSVNLTNYFVTSRDGSRNPDDIAPNSTPKRVRFDFANSTSAGLGATGNYAGIMTFAPWDGTSASTGDSSYQLAFANQSGVNGSGVPMLKIRKGIDGKWGKAWYKFWTDADFNNTNIQQWNYAYQYGLKLNQEFTTNSNTGLMLADNYFGGESGMVDIQQQAFVAGKTGEYYKYGSSIFGGLEGINYHLKSKNVGIGGEADPENKVRVEGCVKATENFKSKDEQADTMFIPNGNLATLRDEIVNDESDYAIRLDPHEYEFDPSGYLEVDDRNRLIHIIGEQTKMVVNFREIYPKQQIVIYNFDKSGGSMAVQIYGKTIYNIEPGFFLRLYVTKSRRVIAERQQPSDFIW